MSEETTTEHMNNTEKNYREYTFSAEEELFLAELEALFVKHQITICSPRPACEDCEGIWIAQVEDAESIPRTMAALREAY